jgi:acyl-CoA thioesterase FadM
LAIAARYDSTRLDDEPCSITMSLYIRLLLVLLKALMRERIRNATDASVVRLRVWPTDLDLAGHMNNGRYATIMDLGRLDLLVRRGLLRPLVRNGWRPLVGASTLRFERSLGPFVRYDLHTRLVCWDDKWFFFEQRFERGGDVCARALVKTIMKSAAGTVRPADVLRSVGLEAVSPPPPPAVAAWVELERLAAERP